MPQKNAAASAKTIHVMDLRFPSDIWCCGLVYQLGEGLAGYSDVMRALALLILPACLAAEPRVLTLKQAIDLALRQNTDLVISRLDEQKASLEVQAIREPLLPRVVVGSGLAYTSGMPMTVEGSAPSIVQAQGIRSIYDPRRGYQVAQAREEARAATLSTQSLREEIALRTATIFLDLERIVRAQEIAARQVESLQRIEGAVRLRVDEGRELPIEGKRAAVNLAQARRRIHALQTQRLSYSQSLSVVLGLSPSEEITPANEERSPTVVPADEVASVSEALKDNSELRRLETLLAAKNMEARSWRAGRLPRVDLVAGYSLLGRFNNYEDFFNKFQRNNGQIGASIQVPLFPNASDEARAAQTEVEMRRLQAQMNDTRARVESDTRSAYRRIADAESGRDFARMDLDLAREQVTVILSQAEEGRASLKQIEEARFQEQERWLNFYDAAAQLERVKLELLKRTNSLVAYFK